MIDKKRYGELVDLENKLINECNERIFMKGTSCT